MKPTEAARSNRGLGRRHRRTRARLLAELTPGTTCPFFGVDPLCTGPMWPEHQDLDADHSEKRVDGGLIADRMAHASCNRRDGQRVAQQRRRAGAAAEHAAAIGPPAPALDQRPLTSRRW